MIAAKAKARGVFVAVPGRGLFFQEKASFLKARGVFVAVPGRGLFFLGKNTLPNSTNSDVEPST